MIDPRSTRAYKLEKENRELKKEIERLNENNQAYQKELCKVWDERDNAYRIINELEKYTISLQTKLQQKENIIKEVREYIEENEKEYGSLEDNEKIILRILDKGE